MMKPISLERCHEINGGGGSDDVEPVLRRVVAGDARALHAGAVEREQERVVARGVEVGRRLHAVDLHRVVVRRA